MNVTPSGRGDIAMGQATAASPALRDYMLTGPATQQDITPASTRRSDGDARFQLVQSESYWAQNDWGAGFGIVYPPDPTSFQKGPVDTLTPNRLRPALRPTGADGGIGGASFMVKCAPNTWFACLVAGAWQLIWMNSAGGLGGAFALPDMPSGLAAYRGYVVVSYTGGLSAFGTEYYTTGGKVTTGWVANAAARPASQLTCAYGSMLFYLRYDASANLWALNRVDPENSTAAVADLAKFPIANTVDNPRAMVALGADLYIVFGQSLWRFTSANGNSGILTGPVDTWAPSGGANAGQWSGVAIGFQGALYYSVGGYLRRYQPGGSARTIWPLPQHQTTPGSTTTVLDFGALEVANDRLYLLAKESWLTNQYTISLLCWDGLGMHQLGESALLSSGSPGLRNLALQARPGTQELLSLAVPYGGVVSGPVVVRWTMGAVGSRAYAATSTWTSSRQDFGMLDIDKTIRQVGVVACCPTDGGIAVSVRTENGTFPLSVGGAAGGTASNAFPPLTSPPKVTYFTLPPVGAFDFQVLTGKVFEILVTMTVGASGIAPEIYAVNAIPNPVNPVRRGFRATLGVGMTVVDRAGTRLYADRAAAEAELATLRAWRAAGTPVALCWVDGQVYYCRINTLTIGQRNNHQGADPWYDVTLDLQELS